MRRTQRALVCWLSVGLLAVGCSGPSGPTVPSDGTDLAASAPPGPTGSASGPGATDATRADGTGSDAGRSDAGRSDAPGDDPAVGDATAGSTGPTGGSSGGGGGDRTRAGGSTEQPAPGSTTGRAPRTRERSSGSPRATGVTTRPAPLNIAPFNVVTGMSWTDLEQRFVDTITSACGAHGPGCVTLQVVVRDTPDFFVDDDCVLSDVDQPEQAFTGDTITVVIEDECGDGYPPPRMTPPDLSGLEGPGWAEVEPLLAERITAVCAGFGAGCLTVTTVVEPDPAGPAPGAPDCVVRFIRTPTYLYADDRPETPEADDVIEVVLGDPCGAG